MEEYIVSKLDANQKIEKYVKKCLNNTPLSMIYKLFRKKDIKVNGKWVNKDYVVKENDQIRIYLPTNFVDISVEKKVNDIKITFDVLYEDDNVLVVNKPVGLLVHEDSNNYYNTLSNQVLAYLEKKDEYNPKVNTFTPGPCHRLDRNTSGIVIFGKNVTALRIFNECFKERVGLKKTYLALLFGSLKEIKEVKCKLLKDENSGLVKVSKEGLDSYSIFNPIKNSDKYTLCEVTLLTGRTHQIRVHSAYINHPVVGDKKYGNFLENSNFKKEFNYENQFLHAYKIEFNNLPEPLDYLNGKIIESNLPLDKQKIISTIF